MAALLPEWLHYYLSLTPLAGTRQLVGSLDVGPVQQQQLQDLKLVAVRRQDDGRDVGGVVEALLLVTHFGPIGAQHLTPDGRVLDQHLQHSKKRKN